MSLSFIKSSTYLETKPANSSFSLLISKVSVYTSLFTSSSKQAISPPCNSLIYRNCFMFSSSSADAITFMFHILNNSSNVSSSITSICLMILVIDDLTNAKSTLFRSSPSKFRSCLHPFRSLHQCHLPRFV